MDVRIPLRAHLQPARQAVLPADQPQRHGLVQAPEQFRMDPLPGSDDARKTLYVLYSTYDTVVGAFLALLPLEWTLRRGVGHSSTVSTGPSSG